MAAILPNVVVPLRQPGVKREAVEYAGVKRPNGLWRVPNVGHRKEANMAKGQKKSNKEIRKPKAEKPKAGPAGGSGSGMIKDASR